MALDGIVVANIVHELNSTLQRRIIRLPSRKDELLLTIKDRTGMHINYF